MLVGVAPPAVPGQTQIRVVQVFDDNISPFGRRYVGGLMTIVAVQRCMFASKREPGLAVIYRFPVRLPPNKWEICAPVFTVAAHTFIASSSTRQPRGMHPDTFCHTLTDLAVALHAPKFFESKSEVVAIGAFQRPGQRLVWLREWARGNLRVSVSSSEHDKQKTSRDMATPSGKLSRTIRLSAMFCANPSVQFPPRLVPAP